MQGWTLLLVFTLVGLTRAGGCALCAQDPVTSASSPGQSASLNAAEVLLNGRNYAAAMDAFEAVLATSPREQRARQGESAAATTWAANEAAAHRAEHSMEILERGLEHVPDDPSLLVSFGLEAMALGQLPIAEQALTAAERLRPGDPTTTYARARLRIEQQQLPAAERDLQAYLAMRPGDATAYFGLGHVYAMQQRDADARAAFQESLRLQPRQTASFYQLGQLALEAQHDEEAQAMFQQVLARDPHHAGALTGMGQLALRAKRYAEAEELLARAEQSDPDYPPSHYFRGLALARLGRREEAEQELRRGDSRPHATAPDVHDGAAPAAASAPAAPPRP